MTVRIRLRRVGAKKKPNYRLVVADSRAPRDGAFIETIGQYNPLTDPETVKVDAGKAHKWLQRGAKPSEPVARLLRKVGVMEQSAERWHAATPASDDVSTPAPEE